MNNRNNRIGLMMLFLISPVLVWSQEAGIRVDSGLSWKQIQKKANAERKFIFMDCHATWCTPCKDMDQNIFSQRQVGEYFNSHFITVKVQMDSTSKDNQDVINWYDFADSIRSRYKVETYPTYLFFSPDGRAVHKLVGTFSTDELIDKSSRSLDPEKQYFTILANQNTHFQDSSFLLQAIYSARDARDEKNAVSFANAYIASLKQPITKPNVILVNSLINSEVDTTFKLFVHNASLINGVLAEKGFVESILSPIIFKEEILPKMSGDSVTLWKKVCENVLCRYPSFDKSDFRSKLKELFDGAIDKQIRKRISNLNGYVSANQWTKIGHATKRKFPDYDPNRLFLNAQMSYYNKTRQWEKCGRAAVKLLDRYERENTRLVNDIIWNCVFLHTTNKKTLERAISLMHTVVSIEPEDVYDMDTYANLLYKTGYKEKAINCENKAIDICKQRHETFSGFESTLIKMQNNEATWIKEDHTGS